MSNNKKVDLFSLDKRVAQRFVQSRQITQKDLEHHLSKLVDLSGQAMDIAPQIFGERKGNAS